MEFNVPADLPADCHGEPLGWRDHLGGSQGVGPGKTQRLWIVDVDGTAWCSSPGTSLAPRGRPASRSTDDQIAEGATFVDADQVAP